MCSRQARPLKDALITVEPRDVGFDRFAQRCVDTEPTHGPWLFGFCESLFQATGHQGQLVRSFNLIQCFGIDLFRLWSLSCKNAAQFVLAAIEHRCAIATAIKLTER